MTSSEIRQLFLDYFKRQGHTIVPSSSLLPDAPNLLFTNAGMNQFVPIFLGQQPCPYKPQRAADTQKCIRAGGKHNDLEDVGLDTYHHTFFEMLGNWSFGDYFKKEAIAWAWELVTSKDWWGFPKERIYATVYKPGPGDPSEFDQEAYNHWASIFTAAGLDPKQHIVFGNKKDNFWMMGDTGPCGPCSELHVDLTPKGDTHGALVNKGSAQCIEIWNLVFMEFNANPDGTFSPLPAKNVDTGAGFERVTSIIQCTKNFTDFGGIISNYETDVFRPIFDVLEKLSGKRYGSTLPKAGELPAAEQEKIDIAFRVIADHIRCLGFGIADGIPPSNEGRGYVLRRILRRAVRYGRSLGFHEPFFYKLVAVLARTMGGVFPEARQRQASIEKALRGEEESFNRTLDRGIELFNEEALRLTGSARVPRATSGVSPEAAVGARYSKRRLPHFERPWAKYIVTFSTVERRQLSPAARGIVLNSLLFVQQQGRYQLYAACVMPDHVHLLFEPQIKTEDAEGKPMFWSLTELLHSIKSFTAHEINKTEAKSGAVWEKESFDRMIRSDADCEEKFNYICQNPWGPGGVAQTEPYQWLWTPEVAQPQTPRRDAEEGTRDACAPRNLTGDFAFKLYDTYGFPLDLTELMAREQGLKVDVPGFEKRMEEQRQRAREDYEKKKSVIAAVGEGLKVEPTKFLGYDNLEAEAVVEAVAPGAEAGEFEVVLDKTPFYAEMGGQVGDTGLVHAPGHDWTELGKLQVLDTQRQGEVHVHRSKLSDGRAPEVGEAVRAAVDAARRANIQRHHTVTHLFHWALHEVVSKDARQRGSHVAPDRMRFDFNHPERLTERQIADIERLVNERIKENAPVYWTEAPYTEIKGNAAVMQFFGEKYGDIVRVVQIGGHAGKFDGYSAELCGGTHTRNTGDIQFFKIAKESAIAAGTRRVEAVVGRFALEFVEKMKVQQRAEAAKAQARGQDKELAKQRQADAQRQAAGLAGQLLAKAQQVGAVKCVVANVGETTPDALRTIVDGIKPKLPSGVVVLGGTGGGKVSLVCFITPDLVKAGKNAGEIVGALAKTCGGGGGGRPDMAQAGGKDPSKLDEALRSVTGLIGG